MTNRSGKGRSRRQVLGLMSGAAASTLLPPIRMSFAQGGVQSGQPLPALLMESYPDQMTVEATRVYARELGELGIQIDHKPQAFGQILGKVYGRKEVVTAVMGFGSPEERLDPDFYLRAIFATGGPFNASHYSNPEFDRVAKAQQEETDPQKRQALIEQAQRILAEDLPSWNICSRDAINTVNKKLFKNFKPSKALGLEVYHVAPYLELEPAGNLREVNVATTFRMSSAHPFTERSANGRGYLRFVYDTFLRYDGELNLKPWAAESYRLVNPTTYELKLRSGMKWHDGKPVTVEDAKFTFDYLLKWKPPFWDSFMAPVKSAEIVDSSTFRITLNAPSATFATLSLVQIAILPKHIWENVPDKVGVKSPMEWDAPGKGGLIGSGPFRFVGFNKDVDCYIRANKEHWTGGPKIDGIHYIQAAGIEQLVGGMEAGNIHIVGDGLTLPDGKRLTQRDGIDLITTNSGTVINFWMDTRQAPFNDKAFRQALYHAMPKQKVIDVALGGAGRPARRSPIPPVFESWIPKDLPSDEYDSARARKILADAGYKWSGNRLVMK
ncbi:MAG: ABC transporter substrate-binding protein [Xanthobacteraceae bacterium]